jgi:hypothetical protein
MRNRNRTIEVLLLGILTGAAVLFSAKGEPLKANAELATSPFTSKYDNVQAGTDKFTPQEERGYAADRQRADHIYDGFGLAVAAYEASPEVSCFAVRHDATSVTVMAALAKSHYSPTSPPAISECPGIRPCSITSKARLTSVATVRTQQGQPMSTQASDRFCVRCRAIAAN